MLPLRWITSFICEKFLALSVADRIKEVRRLKLCINCLRNDHYVKACKKGFCRECNGKHNTLCYQLQADKDSTKSESQDNNHQLAANVAVNHAYHKVKRRRILMATRLEATRCNDSLISIRTFLDSASEANFITQAAYNKLGLKKKLGFRDCDRSKRG